ncbi:MAG: argininosuccinate lyase [Epsilonproteobacteria bacterium]|nr:argininosuccinate lyase [Campylobacterota bacterium]
MKRKIASARIKVESSALLKELNDSLPFDKELFREDIKGSLAHSKMLYNQGIISKDDYEKIKNGLKELLEEIEKGEIKLEGDEDIHMAIERLLTQKIGDAAKRVHTARSRNDQVATDFRLYVLNNTKELASLTLELIDTFLKVATLHTDTLIPGMTHLQHAQPINFGYHLLAYASMFKRDFERFVSSYERNNYSPLGCAALAGTPHPINREETAKELGFKAPTINCLDSVSDRDFALEILFNIAMLMMHISRFSEEVILWSSSEFNFIKLSDKHATGSSIMPQKKNPDIPELLRGKTGRAYGNLMALLTVMKGLPLAYNKDTQEDKEGVFDSVKSAKLSLMVLREMVEEMSINKDSMAQACKKGHLSATDLADYLVREYNMPFRDAYHLVGDIVNRAEELNKDISELSFKELKSLYPKFKEDVVEVLNIENSMNARDSFGGTSVKRTKEQLNILKDWVESQKEILNQNRI